ncbi:MAG: ParB/RepB/Spo0J family partition protein [Calditrichaeota bacterium]|nr:ParB/RepB/Spo0J family partition protein [Calditrichota bacterium]
MFDSASEARPELNQIQSNRPRLTEIDIDKINPDPEQPRKYFNNESLAELAESIRQKGIIQPITVRENQRGHFVIIAGERRYRAAQLAGLATIPVIVSTDADYLIISLIENIHRENLKPIELAEAYQNLIEKHGYTQTELGKLVGKSQNTISEILSIIKLPENIRNNYRNSDKLSINLLKTIIKADTEKTKKELIERVINSDWNVDQVNRFLKQSRGDGNEKPKPQSNPIKLIQRKINDIAKLCSNHPEHIAATIQEIKALQKELKTAQEKQR